MNGLLRRAAAGFGAVLVLTAATEAKAPLVALGQLEPGMWQLRDMDDARATPQSVCIGNPEVLMQIRHPNTACSRTVISNSARGATVQYSCPANGFGRTTLKVETARLAQIETQGIAGNAPFALRAQARRVGDCGAVAAKAPR